MNTCGYCKTEASRTNKEFGPLCEAHYKKWSRYGEPISKKELFEKNEKLIVSLKQDIQDMKDSSSCLFERCKKCNRLQGSSYRCYFCAYYKSDFQK